MNAPTAPMASPVPTLFSPDGQLVSAIAGEGKTQLESVTLPAFLPFQRWFGAKDSTITGVSLSPLGELEPGAHALVAADVAVGGETQRYLLPLSAVWSDLGRGSAGSAAPPVLANINSDSRSGVLIDGALDGGFAKALLQALREQNIMSTAAGDVVFSASEALRASGDVGEPRPLGAEQSNVSIAFGNTIILKLYRRLRSGEQPDVEVARFLTAVGQFANTPEFLGEIQHRPTSGEATTLAAVFAYVPNQGDAWAAVTNALTESLLDGAADDGNWIGAILGQRTAEMHKAFAVDTNEAAFRVEQLAGSDITGWAAEAVAEAHDLLDRLEQNLPSLPGVARAIAEEILSKRELLIERIEAGSAMAPSGGRSRIHGDYHLGQVLVTGRDVMIIDFEGEPKRSLPERRAKSSPLRDVAGMLRSFHYAAWTALSRYQAETGSLPDGVRTRVEDWRRGISADFVAAYETSVAGALSFPPDPALAKALTEMFLLQKAIYEVGYELANRPAWVEIPLSGIKDLLSEG
ncbi:putative maltokinase [Devosia sp. 1566]|uniref:putative maltokinase n=1 Tax=Devosia sp. 1566 TaxID=2499144 RepID=UPI000FDAEE9D|nr:putative maltokinase [Devosia sp. 1566]